MKRQLISSAEAKPAKGQHDKPCSDCPLSRTSLAGWLGGDEPMEWVSMLHSETRIECHTLKGAQCAGAAVYRANVAKSPRDPSILVLPRDTRNVFATPDEFLKHHKGGPEKMPATKTTDHKANILAAVRALESDRSLSKQEYHDVLSDLLDDLESRMFAVKCELDP